MASILEPAALAALVQRLNALTDSTPRRWGTLSAGEMLCHLADAADWVVGRRIPPGVTIPKPNPVMKWLALRAPMRWPKTVPTRPGFDPKREGTKPGDFAADRRRVIDSLTALAAAPAESLTPAHMMFGPMTKTDWARWAYRHTDHHLRQFGL